MPPSDQTHRQDLEGLRHALTAAATAARSFIEPVWGDWHDAWGGPRPSPLSRNTCGRSSLFLVKVLAHQGLAAEWKSGTPRLSEAGPEVGPFGFRPADRWESHAWVQAGGFIVDITADQFGHAPVIVVPVGDGRYSPGERDTALPVDVENRARAVAAIWESWLHVRELQTLPCSGVSSMPRVCEKR